MKEKTLYFIGGTQEAYKNFRIHLINFILRENPYLNITCIHFDNPGKAKPMVVDQTRVKWVSLKGSHNSSIIFDFCPLLRLIWYLIYYRPNYIVVFNAKPIFYTGILKFFRIAPVNTVSLLEGLGFGFSSLVEKGNLNALKRKMIIFSMRNFKKWIFLNKVDPMNLTKLGVLNPSMEKLTINGIGIHFPFFQSSTSVEERWRLKSVGFCGRFIEEKGVHVVAETAQIVKSAINDVSFNLAGRTMSFNDATNKNLITDWKKQGVIDSAQYFDDIREFYEKQTIIILPTTYNEGLPAVAMESQYMRIPILLNKLPQVFEAIPIELQHHLIDKNSPQEFAELIIKYLSSLKDYEYASKKCYKFALSQFDSDKKNKEICKFLLKM